MWECTVLSEPGFSGLVDLQDCESEVQSAFDKIIPFLIINVPFMK